MVKNILIIKKNGFYFVVLNGARLGAFGVPSDKNPFGFDTKAGAEKFAAKVAEQDETTEFKPSVKKASKK